MYNPNSIWTSKNKEIAQPASAPEPRKVSVPIGKEVKPPSQGGFNWALWAAAAFGIVLILAGVWYVRSITPPTPPSVVVSLAPPSQIFVGDPFVVSISVKNESNFAVTSGTLMFSLPEGISLVGQSPDEHSFTYTLPDIAGGSSATVTSTLIATGNSQNASRLSAQAAYYIASSSKQFTAGGTIDMAIGSPAAGLTITAPPSVVGESNMRLVLKYANNTPDILPSMALTLTHPPAFTFQTSSVAVFGGDIAWPLGSLMPGASGTITIDGIVDAAAPSIGSGQASGATYGFGGTFTETLSGQTYVINGPTANVAIISSPLSVSIMANNSSSYVSVAGDWLSYALKYANNTNVPFIGATITAKLTGAMFDFSTLQTAGSFNSITDTITWSPSAVPALATLAPGETGTVAFRVKTLKRISAQRASDKDYTLRVDGKIFSLGVLPGVTATSTMSGDSLTTKVGGAIAVAANGYRYDTMSGITNAGPYPPVVDQETDYTIHWILTTTLTDMSNVIVSTSLPAGIAFTGAVWSNVSSTPQYNPATGAVTWQLPSAPAAAGTVATAPEAAFQVSDTPSVNQVGQVISLLGQTIVQATDAFTGNALVASANAVSTDLSKDSIARKSGGGAVVAK